MSAYLSVWLPTHPYVRLYHCPQTSTPVVPACYWWDIWGSFMENRFKTGRAISPLDTAHYWWSRRIGRLDRGGHKFGCGRPLFVIGNWFYSDFFDCPALHCRGDYHWITGTHRSFISLCTWPERSNFGVLIWILVKSSHRSAFGQTLVRHWSDIGQALADMLADILADIGLLLRNTYKSTYIPDPNVCTK